MFSRGFTADVFLAFVPGTGTGRSRRDAEKGKRAMQVVKYVKDTLHGTVRFCSGEPGWELWVNAVALLLLCVQDGRDRMGQGKECGRGREDARGCESEVGWMDSKDVAKGGRARKG